MATPHAQNRSADVRKAALNLLETILSTEEQCTQNTKVLDGLHILSQDKHVKIRKRAQALYKKYIPATTHSARLLPRHHTGLLAPY